MFKQVRIQLVVGLVFCGGLLGFGRCDELKSPPLSQRHRIDESQAAAEGIKKLSGKRITLYTDVEKMEVERLPEIFSLAFPQWCKYFHVLPDRLADWSMTGFLMQKKNKKKFKQTGLLPADLPEFKHGFSVGKELWLYDPDPPSDYYRRHLLLHEGTHGFMNTVLGGCGPSWYMEGMAELLATHKWKDGRLTLNYLPKNREEVPYWGRIRIIKDGVRAGHAQTLQEIIENRMNVDQETEYYAWCWAAAAFLDGHPRYRGRFRQLYKHVRDRNFNQYVLKIFHHDWRQLNEEWQAFLAGLEYGYDISRTVIDFTPGQPLLEKKAAVAIAADRGWQNTGIQLQQGVNYRLTASGRYQVANKPKIWWCEPGGVSIRYYKGRPLGILLAVVRPEQPLSKSPSAFLKPTTIGRGSTITPEQSGTLYLKINDSAAELDDNAGKIKVEIQPY
ncbi:MAG: hypothetical protein ACWGMZ_04410 [Thermoguttaceae bacterium]